MGKFEAILKNVSRVVLRGGMFGKVCHVLIVVSVCFAAIACTAGVYWISLIAIGLIFLLCFPILWRIISFADKNPQAAILEGAELLIHEQITLGSKADPHITATIKDYVAPHLVTLPSNERKSLMLPDPPPVDEENSVSQIREEHND